VGRKTVNPISKSSH